MVLPQELKLKMSLVTFLFTLLFSSCWVETTADNKPLTLSIQWYEFSCIGGDNALLSTGLWLSYTSIFTDETGTGDQTYSCRVWVNYNSSLPELQYYEGAGPRNITSVSLSLNNQNMEEEVATASTFQ